MRWIFINVFVVSSALAQQAAPPSKVFNPDISANFLGRYRYESRGITDRTDPAHDGLSLDESEIQFTADVDTYFRAAALISLSQEDGTTDFGIEPEEVYFETLSLPRVTLKGGKFKAAFGRHNQLHTHAFPFIDAPMINDDLTTDEGLNDVGVSAAVLFPFPWYSELTAQAIGTGNDVLYNSGNSRNVAGVGSIKNLWDLTDDLTLEWGLFGTAGPNAFDATTLAYGSDLILKWRPAEGGKYKAWIWQTEYIDGKVSGNPAGERLGGIATWFQFQFAQRWWIQAREEYEGIARSNLLPWKIKESALIGFFPSEFSGFRLQYDHIQIENEADRHAITAQVTISIGAHPAHAY
jgi:hypothetical protein